MVAKPAKIIVYLPLNTCVVVVAEPAKIIDHLSLNACVNLVAEPAKTIVYLSLNTCAVVVAEPAKIIDHLSSGATVVVQEGDTVELVCNVTGVPHPTVTWYRIPTGLMHDADRAEEANRRKKRESVDWSIGFSSVQSFGRPRSGELRTQTLKSHLVRTLSLNVLALKAWSRSVYSHTCYAYCQ